ncbi:regulatory subunit Rpn2 of 26S proteasome [Hamiltosporidium magnivora]|uniref:Regulatory subunit Rpn2 of 26S proteasome n=1 Tax=Hamiltosporidium magnivora TaxID=148818 RepID=A0A4Q9L0C8_9MICR|nr:regulatory subunit Rpn2 of 26S proteasome [Hamiltosporidium magnivora]
MLKSLLLLDKIDSLPEEFVESHIHLFSQYTQPSEYSSPSLFSLHSFISKQYKNCSVLPLFHTLLYPHSDQKDLSYFIDENELSLKNSETDLSSLLCYLVSTQQYKSLPVLLPYLAQHPIIPELILKMPSLKMYRCLSETPNLPINILIDSYFYTKKDKIPQLLSLLYYQDKYMCFNAGLYLQETYPYFSNEIINNSTDLIINSDENKNLDESSVNKDNEILISILDGSFREKVILKFFLLNNKNDFSLLSALSRYKSMLTSSNIVSLSYVNAFINIKSTNDTFYRNNIEIFSSVKQMSKFVSIMCIGIIHKGNNSVYEVLKNMFPVAKGSGGSLMALGLVNCGFWRQEDITFITMYMEKGSTEEIVYGACVGLGLVCMGKKDKEVVEKLLLKIEGGLASEGAALGIGLVMLNEGICFKEDSFLNICENLKNKISKNFKNETLKNEDSESQISKNLKNENSESQISETSTSENNNSKNLKNETLKNQNSESQISKEENFILNTFNSLKDILINSEHERVARNSAVSISFMFCMSRDKYRKHINDMICSGNVIERMAGYLGLGTSYCGSEDSEVTGVLLKGMNDNDSGVRRVSVIGVGLVLCSDREKCFKFLQFYSGSHDTVVICSVGLVLGFLFCGSGDERVVRIAENMMKSSDGVVRQVGCICAGLVLMQCSGVCGEGGVYDKERYYKVVDRINILIMERSDDYSARFGGVLGRGLLECGSRNCFFSLFNSYGKITGERVVGFVLFMMYWYFYPYIGFLSLCVQPSGYFRVDEEGEWIDSVIYSEKVKRNDPVIKLPESKKSRKLKRRLGGIKEEVKVEEEEVAGYYVESGGRVCYNEKEDFGLEDWGIKIEKKKEPDIFILDKKKNKITRIEVGITSQDSLQIVETEKLRKYDLLANDFGLIYSCSV